MNEQAHIALEKSINHWRYNLRRAKEGKNFDVKGDACALCNMFAHRERCKGCPISDYTGLGNCMNTPWYRVFEMMQFGTDEDIVEAVRSELNFLISLRPDKRR